jgi:hypothetical protein
MSRTPQVTIGRAVRIAFSDTYKKEHPNYSSIWDGAIAVVSVQPKTSQDVFITVAIGKQELCIEREFLRPLLSAV